MFAYDPLYLHSAQTVLGGALEYAVYALGWDLSAFYGIFLATAADDFGGGEADLLAGCSGAELACRILQRAGMSADPGCKMSGMDFSEEYWAGWTVAYCQWKLDTTFHVIERCISIGEVREMYYPYHEMDPDSFAEYLESRIREKQKKTALARFRAYASLSQSQLAARSEVPVRTIQQYEQRQKDLSRAGAEQVNRLARALSVSTESLLRG